MEKCWPPPESTFLVSAPNHRWPTLTDNNTERLTPLTMNRPTLIIANKNYSSWSLRPWLALKVNRIDFDEQFSNFDHATNHAHFWDFSPTKKVPVLVIDGETIWDSLAILETLADTYPERLWWPSDRIIRSHARSVSAEMHSGFPFLRTECPMNMRRTPSAIELTNDCRADVKRIETLWEDCLNRYGGPFLFGKFSIADAMYAPVVNRFEVYMASQHPAVEAYSSTIKQLPAWQEGDAAARAETWVSELVEK